MNTTKLIAVDPGITGALAFYDAGSGRLDIVDMPSMVVGPGQRKGINEIELEALLRTFCEMGYNIAFVEQVGGMPGQSAPHAFTFGYGAGLLRGILRGLGMRIEPVRPQVWKTRLKVPADKSAARARASELLPAHAHFWPLVKHDGRAEAALLSVYGEIVTRTGR